MSSTKWTNALKRMLLAHPEKCFFASYDPPTQEFLLTFGGTTVTSTKLHSAATKLFRKEYV